MNKNLLKRIASVATELDQSGFTKEAKNMDLILLKLAQEEMEDANQGNLDNEDNGMGDAKKKLGPIDKIRGFFKAVKEKYSPEEQAMLNDLLKRKFLPLMDEIDKIITFDERSLKVIEALSEGKISYKDPRYKILFMSLKLTIKQAKSNIEKLDMSSKYGVKYVLPIVLKNVYKDFGPHQEELRKLIFHVKGAKTASLFDKFSLGACYYLMQACKIAGCEGTNNEQTQST